MTKFKKLIPNEFYKQIKNFTNIYIEISGGYHSSNTVLEFYQKEYKNIFLIFNETYLEYKETKENIQKLVFLTGYPLIITYPKFKKYKNMSFLMKLSFRNIEKAKGLKNYRDYFPCCKVLKKRASIKFIHDNLLENSIIISSLTPYESFQRQMRLFELKKQNTFVRFHKTQNCFKGYPYRDLLHGCRKHSRKIYDFYFMNNLDYYNLNLCHSGCLICPIRIMNPIMLEKNDLSINYNKIVNKL